jgi:hypothetical protein
MSSESLFGAQKKGEIVEIVLLAGKKPLRPDVTKMLEPLLESS